MAGQISEADMAKLLKNPELQDAMKAAGEKALADPKVQEVLIAKAQQTFTPENAALVASKAKEWASDPAVQAKARYAAGMAMHEAGALGQRVIGCIEQGPAGLRILAFSGGVFSTVLCFWYMLHVTKALTHPLVYATTIFKIIFAMTTMLFEMNPDWLNKIPGLNGYHDMLIKWFAFLTTSFGRGSFYLFQGIMWLDIASLTEWLAIICGAYLSFVGILTILMHFGIMPQQVAAKMKSAGAQARSTIAGRGAPSAGGERAAADPTMELTQHRA